jgi:hypothetical protein
VCLQHSPANGTRVLFLSSCCHCRLALERSLINCQGKTPEATMASALYTDVRKKGQASVFIRWVLA